MDLAFQVLGGGPTDSVPIVADELKICTPPAASASCGTLFLACSKGLLHGSEVFVKKCNPNPKPYTVALSVVPVRAVRVQDSYFQGVVL